MNEKQIKKISRFKRENKRPRNRFNFGYDNNVRPWKFIVGKFDIGSIFNRNAHPLSMSDGKWEVMYYANGFEKNNIILKERFDDVEKAKIYALNIFIMIMGSNEETVGNLTELKTRILNHNPELNTIITYKKI